MNTLDLAIAFWTRPGCKTSNDSAALMAHEILRLRAELAKLQELQDKRRHTSCQPNDMENCS